jgi:hypothetical protein
MALIGTAEGSVPSPQKQCNIEQPVPALSQYFHMISESAHSLK